MGKYELSHSEVNIMIVIKKPLIEKKISII